MQIESRDGASMMRRSRGKDCGTGREKRNVCISGRQASKWAELL